MLSSRNQLMLTGLGALLATVVLFAVATGRPGGDGALLTADAAPTTSPTTTTTTTTSTTAITSTTGTTAATTTATSSASPTSGVEAPTPFATDERGFVNYAARCGEAQRAMAFGRTARSLVAICPGSGGKYEYRGVRVSDGAALTTAAEGTDNGFVAYADGATYSVTAAELLVTSGGKVIYRDTWIDFQQPRSDATPTSATATSTTPTSTTSTSTTAASTSTLPSTARPTG